jgi:phosphatidate cytidylyltransferase
MKVRVITAIVGIAVLFPFFWFSDPMGLSHPITYIFPFGLAVLALFSVWELLHCVGLDKNYALSVPVYLAAVVCPMLARVLGELNADFAKLSVIMALVFAVYFLAVIVFQFGKLDMGKAALTFLVCFYVIGSFSSFVILRDIPVAGRFLFLIPLIFSWVTDTFAYFCGRLFGKHKLIPTVSPKKTVEGAVGGAIFCALTAFAYGLVVNACFGVAPNYPTLIVSGLLISVVSQIGDLAMSAVKREHDLKDFGKILPGHGGFLDRFDSSIAVAVVVLAINTYLPLFQVV